MEAMNSASSSQCPKCRAEIPAGAPQGVCPRCLMAQAMQPTVVASDPPVAPPDAEIVEAFPQFEVLEVIGVGGMGRVYKVRQPHLERVAALKILPRELAADPAFAERFMREGRALAKCRRWEKAAAAAREQMSALPATDIKFCGVDDPTCESCQ